MQRGYTGPMHAKPQRVLSIDVLRGLTIALMILVNTPGDWNHLYRQLDHSIWNGFTLTDFVFPNFLFLVGASIILSIQSRTERGESRRTQAWHILRRSFYLFVLGIALNILPNLHYHRLRIFGVIFRIAVCSLAAGLICLWTRRPRTLALIAASLLVGYWAVMRFAPVPGSGVPTHGFPLLDPDRNLAAWIDRAFSAFTQHWLHTGRLYERTRDPEGLLSTLPALATTLLGALTALWLRRPALDSWIARQFRPIATTAGLFLAGLLSLSAGLLWSLSFPLNKKLWTSSYVLFAAGISAMLLAVLHDLIDIRGLGETRVGRILAWPWLVFGSNAITAFITSEVLEKVLAYFKFANPDGGNPVSLMARIYRNVFASHGSTVNTSLAFAIVFTLACFLPNLYLWRKGIFLKL